MTYAGALAYLGASRRFGMKLGLEPMRQLAAALGRPQDALRFIHLAGTNGKGSTAAFCESCLRAAGHRVGLYTSPHLVSVRERIQVNREPISEADFAAGMQVVQEAIAGTLEPASTFFEIMTGLALWYFARERVDWVVWETGLGGRLDATNIVEPEICIITNIGLDHQQYLGQSLGEIAAEKAGIIKEGVPVVSAVNAGEARDVIGEQASQRKCLLSWVNGGSLPENLGLIDGKQRARLWFGHEQHDFDLGLVGGHQVENAACAVAAIDHIRWGHAPGFLPADQGVGLGAITGGLGNTVWPGRFEVLSTSPLIVLDGAHNPAGTARLAETWRAFLASRHPAVTARARLVFASVTDKDITETARLLTPLAGDVSFVQLGSERGASPVSMAESFPDLPHTFYASVADLWRDLESASPEIPILVTGSLFLVGEVLAHRQGSTEEYRLNERLGTALTR